MDIILIAAVTLDGYIARHAHEQISWSRDLQLFKEQTLGYPVIMGSNTYGTLKTDLERKEVVVVHRKDDPEKILHSFSAEKCFIAGGGRTNARYAPYLTHLYLTPHPLVFGQGIPLFKGLDKELKLLFLKKKRVKDTEEIYQYQYKVIPSAIK